MRRSHRRVVECSRLVFGLPRVHGGASDGHSTSAERCSAGFDRGSVHYVNNSGIESQDPLSVILPHFFNHQTHHRAQVHTLLSQLGHAPPVLDLHRVLRPNP